MLPQHLVCTYELNCEYCNITLARNKVPWWWSDKIETCRSVLKCFKSVLCEIIYVHSLVDKLKWFYENARCYNKIFRNTFCFNALLYLCCDYSSFVIFKRSSFCEISDLRREVDENCVLLPCYVASSGNSLPTFRDNLSVSSWSLLKVGPIGCPEMSVRNSHSLRIYPK